MGRPLDPHSTHWKTLRSKILARDKMCFICQVKYGLTVHHIKPRHKGGRTVERNLLTLCGECHNTVELTNGEWSVIINLRKQKKNKLSGDSWDPHGKRRVGRDKYGVFVIHDANPNDPIVYDGLWPTVKKVEEQPIDWDQISSG